MLASINIWTLVLVLQSMVDPTDRTVIVKEYSTKVECELKASMFIRYSEGQYVEYTCERTRRS
jgi:hypothetical protein